MSEKEKKVLDQLATDDHTQEKIDEKSEESKEPEEQKDDENDKKQENKPVEETSDTSSKTVDKDDTQVKETAPVTSKVKSEVDEANTVKYNGPKHGVKVILLSLPEMNTIIEKVFGYDFERQSSSGHYYPLNKLISFLAFRNQNDGYSLIGGKFNAQLDGLVGDQPNLIATAIRCVKEQTGIDLSRCSKWVSVASFLYNKDDALHDRPHTEYSTIFMPDIWSLLDDTLLPPPPPPPAPVAPTCEDVKVPKEEPTSPPAAPEGDSAPSDAAKCEPKVDSEQVPAPTPMEISSEQSLELEKLDELKVVELKSKLDELGVKYARTLKKAELLSLLREQLTEQIKVENESSFQIEKSHESQVTSSPSNCSSVPEPVKRKVEADADSQNAATDEPPSKKATIEAQTVESTQVKESSEQMDTQQTPPDESEGNVVKDVMKEKIIDVTGDFSFTLLTLHQALIHHKHDHFELSICAEVLRESLIRSFGFFIVSSLSENSSNLNSSVTESPCVDRRKVRAPNYSQLVFSYFDERHTGTLSSDDVLALVIHSGYKISKKSWLAVTCNCDKIQYKNFNPPSTIIKPLDIASPVNDGRKQSSSSSSASSENVSCSVIVKDGIVYNCDNLIRQADAFAKAQIQLQELTQKLEERDKQLSNFETRQKKMTSAIEKQNDEICALKRERESLKSKVDEQKKAWTAVRESFDQHHTLF